MFTIINAMRKAFVVGIGLCAGLSAAAAADAETTHASQDTSQGVAFHFGVVPAEIVQAHPSDHPESGMHGGSGKGQRHLVLALFDAATGDRIREADVQATVTQIGGAGATKRLQPMEVARQPSFGGFFSMVPGGIYRIRFEVKRPGSATAVKEFEYRVPR